MSIEELLELMEQGRSRKDSRDYRPEWLKKFISSVADLFEPLACLGRVGYDCRLDERGWTVSLYIGTTEIIGGPRDGQIDHVSFRLDILKLQQEFREITRLEWYSVSENAEQASGIPVRSLLSVHGCPPDGETLRLELLGVPPIVTKPGLHLRTDGVFYETR